MSLPDSAIMPRPAVRHGLLLIACCLGFIGLPTPAVHAQIGNAVPTDMYLNTFGAYFDGDYYDALRAYVGEGRGAIKTAQSNWIDSICYHAMAGECFYQMGQFPQALAHFNTALQLYTAFPDWMIRVQFSPGVMPIQQGQIRPIPWGQRQRVARLGHFPDVVPTLQGQVNNNQVVQQGGVVRPAMLFPIRPIEIVRCTALSIRRRRELLGPLGEHDALAKDVLAALARRPTQPNHWSEAWIDLQLGLAYTAVGKIDQAKPVLERALLVAGEYDHPLSSTAFLELGRIALLQSDHQAAARYFEEATYSAYEYEDPGILEEAFRLGFVNHLMAGTPDAYPPLLIAATWAKAQGLRQLHVSLVISAAENLAVLGQTRQAAVLLTEARGMIGNRNMLRGRIGARLNYALAVACYQGGQTADGDVALANLLNYQQASSQWLFQLTTTDGLTTGGALSQRAAMLVYEQLLREPDGFDWGYDPIETLSIIGNAHSESYENWFRVALERDKQLAFQIADETRRHRFLSTLPIGGRLLGLRWLLEGPSEMLDRQANLDRQILISRFADYDLLSQQSRDQRAKLTAAPLVPDTGDASKAQVADVAHWGEISQSQEQLLRAVAVRRNPGARLFPPRRTLQNVQQSLGEGHAVLAFLTTSDMLYGFLVTASDYDVWPIDSPLVVQRRLAALLKEMGQTDQNRELTREQLQSEKWKRHANELFELLTGNIKSNFPEGVQELVIVPDRALWYLPFAACQVGPAGHTEPLISKLKLRIAPTTGTAVGDTRGVKPRMNTLVIPGRLFPRSDPAITPAFCDQLAQALPSTVKLTGAPPAPSATYASLIDRLIVLDDLKINDKQPYGWSPLPDHSAHGELAEWLAFPWGAPDQVILPGFHSAAENGLKKHSAENLGDDLFLNICGLLGSGTRTILISQWRTGGGTSLDLVREFAQELPHTSAPDAWQRSVALVMEETLSPDREPRAQIDKKKDAPKAINPFFWSGYLLVDPGPPGKKPDEVVDEKQPGQPAAGDDKQADEKDDALPKEVVQIGGGAKLGDDGSGDANFDDPTPGAKGKKPKKQKPPRVPRGKKKPAPDAADTP